MRPSLHEVRRRSVLGLPPPDPALRCFYPISTPYRNYASMFLAACARFGPYGLHPHLTSHELSLLARAGVQSSVTWSDARLTAVLWTSLDDHELASPRRAERAARLWLAGERRSSEGGVLVDEGRGCVRRPPWDPWAPETPIQRALRVGNMRRMAGHQRQHRHHDQHRDGASGGGREWTASRPMPTSLSHGHPLGSVVGSPSPWTSTSTSADPCTTISTDSQITKGSAIAPRDPDHNSTSPSQTPNLDSDKVFPRECLPPTPSPSTFPSESMLSSFKPWSCSLTKCVSLAGRPPWQLRRVNNGVETASSEKREWNQAYLLGLDTVLPRDHGQLRRAGRLVAGGTAWDQDAKKRASRVARHFSTASSSLSIAKANITGSRVRYQKLTIQRGRAGWVRRASLAHRDICTDIDNGHLNCSTSLQGHHRAWLSRKKDIRDEADDVDDVDRPPLPMDHQPRLVPARGGAERRRCSCRRPMVGPSRHIHHHMEAPTPRFGSTTINRNIHQISSLNFLRLLPHDALWWQLVRTFYRQPHAAIPALHLEPSLHVGQFRTFVPLSSGEKRDGEVEHHQVHSRASQRDNHANPFHHQLRELHSSSGVMRMSAVHTLRGDSVTITLIDLRRTSRRTARRAAEEVLVRESLVVRGVTEYVGTFVHGDTWGIVSRAHGDDLVSYVLLETPEGRLDEPTTAVQVLMPVLLALNSAHERGWIHGNVRMEHVVRHASGVARLGGWNNPSRWNPDHLDHLDHRDLRPSARTPVDYMAPERLIPTSLSSSSSMPVFMGPAIDAWAVGCLTFELLVGKLPFEVDSVEQTVALIRRADVTTWPRHISREVRLT